MRAGNPENDNFFSGNVPKAIHGLQAQCCARVGHGVIFMVRSDDGPNPDVAGRTARHVTSRQRFPSSTQLAD